VASLLAAQRTYLHVFGISGPPAAVQLYEQKRASPVFAEVEARERLAFGSGLPRATRPGFGVDSGDWFRLMTRKIDLLKEVEKRGGQRHPPARRGPCSRPPPSPFARPWWSGWRCS
jgi:hypothetical protein